MEEENVILFSGVGDTDPYRNGYDGSLCHILRKYKNVRKVYLYFTKEIIQGEIYNKRYTRAIKTLNPEIEIEIYPKIEELNELLNKEEVTQEEVSNYLEKENRLIKDAQRFDVFYPEFYEVFEDIKRNERDRKAKILLNMSSGTPAMKTAIMIMDIMESKTRNNKNCLRTQLIQVDSPARGSGKQIPHSSPKSFEEYKEENVEQIMKDLYDTLIDDPEYPDVVCRCGEQNLKKTTQVIINNNIKEMFEKLDYYGASNLVEKYEDILPKELVCLAKHLKRRITGKDKEAKEFAKYSQDSYYHLYPVRDDKEQVVIEKFNMMKIKGKREEYNDWLLISTPLLESIYVQLLEIKGISKQDYSYEDGNRTKVDLEKLKTNHMDLYNRMEKKVNINREKNGDLNGHILVKLIEWAYNNENDVLEKIEHIEKSRKYRNKAAHTLSFVDIDEFKEEVGAITESEKEIRFLIERAFNKVGNQDFSNAFNIYTTIEKDMLNILNEEIQSKDE